ncbi:prepro-carboxypeptidase Z [Gigaspora margarita]|uniref:Carboxypeptidase n=1 Tax=Gigaspora margarita TaxID=4874 RepID=A0A8H4ARN7_GIGMA|nr:prepro-carboxypeptidase Z [Gigaspora margarita]
MDNFHLSRNSFNNLRFSLFSLQLHFVVIWLLCVALFVDAVLSLSPSSSSSPQNSSASNFSSSKLCDPTVKQYSGYIQTSDGSNMYFWFLESRNNPTSSPLPLFINDGPGCSSMIGLFQELGPCSSLPNGTNTTINPYSWNNVSNVLFVDQPVGAGFSYGNNYLTSSQQAASDLFEFMQIWCAKFPQYASLPFHIFGESYAGHYIPPFALMILSGTSDLLSVNLLNINLSVQKPMMNLKSIGIGDGWIDPMIQYESLMDYSQQNSLVSSGVFSNMSASLPEDYINFLPKPEVMSAIGAKTQYIECNPDAYIAFTDTADLQVARTSISQLGQLMNCGIPALFYFGDSDANCNWIGGLNVTKSINWKYQKNFNSATLRDFNVNNAAVGQVQSSNGLTFLKMYQSGHEVPFINHKMRSRSLIVG